MRTVRPLCEFVCGALVTLSGCGTSSTANDSVDGGPGVSSAPGVSDGGRSDASTSTDPSTAPPAGNPDGTCDVPAEAAAEDVSNPTTVIGDGTKESCTGDAVVKAVAKGGVITFACGPDPVTITLTETAKVYNDAAAKVVIDGGNKVTLSGGGKVRILYQNSCSAELHGGANCNDQEKPALTVQNITFVDGNSSAIADDDNGGGGGAIWVRGGRFKVVGARFFGNVCADAGSDLGGGAIRVLDFPSKGTSETRPVYIVKSTFGAPNMGNHGANGGALSSIGASYTVIDSVFTNNEATGHGANSGQGGNGGAIYNDGNTYKLELCGVRMEENHANEGGSAVFYVSNDKTGSFVIKDSVFQNNPKGTFETADYPGMFIIAKPGDPEVENSTFK